MGRLRNLQVERADAVGSPATGHKWVILKSSNEAVEKAAAIEKAAGDALTALVKEAAGLTFSKETVDALKALAAALEVEDAEFTVKSDEDTPEDTDVEKDNESETDESESADESESGESADESEESNDDSEKSDESEGDVEKKETYTRDEAEELVKQTLVKFGIDVETLMKGADLGTSRLAVAKSRQPKDAGDGTTSRRVKKGDGIFTNVIFGQD